MPSRPLFIAATAGIVMGLAAAWYFSEKHPPQPPAFSPASNPYPKGIYANGIIESLQDSGENVPIYPEVSGSVLSVGVSEGQVVKKGAPLVMIDPTVQEQIVAQQRAQADAARALLTELKAQPRPEALAVARAQVDAAEASARQLRDQYDKLRRSADMDARSISKEALDTAANALKVAEANLGVAQRQLELTRAGAWSFDVEAQAQNVSALERQYQAASALLGRYTLRAPVDGVVMAVNVAVGGYVSPTGTYRSYTESSGPAVIMSHGNRTLGVRVFVDEILVHRMPAPDQLVAQMQLRGTDRKVPLRFLRIQPYVTPKIELSDERQELVDVRVLPILFTFVVPKDLQVYPGQMVDVYIGASGGG